MGVAPKTGRTFKHMESGNAEIHCDRGATCDHFGRTDPISSTISLRMKPGNSQVYAYA